jgi:hypothetical protein
VILFHETNCAVASRAQKVSVLSENPFSFTREQVRSALHAGTVDFHETSKIFDGFIPGCRSLVPLATSTARTRAARLTTRRFDPHRLREPGLGNGTSRLRAASNRCQRGSLSARIPILWISGVLTKEVSRLGFSIKAAATLTLRCALRPASSSKASKMANLAGPLLNSEPRNCVGLCVY